MINEKKDSIKYILILIVVVCLWGICPITDKLVLNYYSPIIKAAMGTLISAVAFFFISIKKLRLINKEYVKVSVISGAFYALGIMFEYIGLSQTSPAICNILGNSMCIYVPFIVWILTKQKQPACRFIGSALCILGVCIICNVFNDFSGGFGLSELFCALSALCYGIYSVLIGLKAKDLEPTIVLFINNLIALPIIFIIALSAEIFTPSFMFSLNPLHILFLAGATIGILVFGWLLKNIALKKVDATVVSIAMPCSSIVTGTLSVIMGMDTISLNLVLGGMVSIIAVIISDLDFSKFKKRKSVDGKVSKLETNVESSNIE